MRKVHQGARTAVRQCVKFREGEKAVVLYDNFSSDVVLEVVMELYRVSTNVKTFNLDDLRPNTTFTEEIKKNLKEADVSFFMAECVDGEFKSFRKPLLDYVQDHCKKLRHAHMPDIAVELMEQGMCVDYSKVAAVTKNVYDSVKNATYARVTNHSGTDYVVRFTKKHRWLAYDGNITSELWMNLPEGEVFTCPDSMNGVAVIDSVVGDIFETKYGIIKDTPLTLEIEDGRVSKISCANKDLEDDLREYMQRDENANRIGEWAIGTNIGVKGFIGNMLQDEKYPGNHFAFGDGCKRLTNCDWESDVHADVIVTNATIDVEGNVIMKDGKFRPDIYQR